jgi:hypothetical protein
MRDNKDTRETGKDQTDQQRELGMVSEVNQCCEELIIEMTNTLYAQKCFNILAVSELKGDNKSYLGWERR